MKLFQPVTLGQINLPNRIVMAPLSRARADIVTRTPLPRMAIYYAQRATAGLIITEATHVSTDSVSRPGGAAIHTIIQGEGWRQVVRAVHEAGGRIVQQLYHVGRKAAQAQMPDSRPPVAPSALAASGEVTTAQGKQPFSMPRALAGWEISGVVGQFRAAALRSREAGFDGIEIHAANGYLIEQFLRSDSNQRVDDYGGSVHRRARFLLEVLDAVLEVWPAARVGVRLAPGHTELGLRDDDPVSLYDHVAQQLHSRRIAYLHVVESDAPEVPPFAPMLRRAFGGPMVLCGGFTRSSANAAIESHHADAIAFGTLFIANPDLVLRLRLDAELNPPQPHLYRHGGDEGYIDYPVLGQHSSLPHCAAHLES